MFPVKHCKKVIFLALFLAIFLLPLTSQAAVDTGTGQVDSSIALGNTSPIKVATNVINVLMGFLSLIAVSLILYAGWLWMSSNGSAEKIDKAKKILKNSVIGLIIILSAWGITYFILKKIVNGTGGQSGGSDGCTDGVSVSCGCGGAQTCNGGTGGAWLGSPWNPVYDG